MQKERVLITLYQNNYNPNKQSNKDKKGEYSLENLAFKQLRYNGYLEKLNDLKKEKTIKGFELDVLNICCWSCINFCRVLHALAAGRHTGFRRETARRPRPARRRRPSARP